MTMQDASSAMYSDGGASQIHWGMYFIYRTRGKFQTRVQFTQKEREFKYLDGSNRVKSLSKLLTA